MISSLPRGKLVAEGSHRRVVANGISILNCRLEASQSRITNETILADHDKQFLENI